MPIRRLLLAALMYLLLCATLAACASTASGPELGGLRRINCTEESCRFPGSFFLP